MPPCMDLNAIDANLFRKAVRRCRVLPLCHHLLRLRLRQEHIQPSQVPQEPGSDGDSANTRVASNHGHLHSLMLPRRGARIQQAVRHNRVRSGHLVQLLAIPVLHPLHRPVHLLDTPRATPSLRIQTSAQGAPQVDHANALCLARVPPA